MLGKARDGGQTYRGLWVSRGAGLSRGASTGRGFSDSQMHTHGKVKAALPAGGCKNFTANCLQTRRHLARDVMATEKWEFPSLRPAPFRGVATFPRIVLAK